MKKLLKILGALVALLLLGAGGFVGLKVSSWQPTFPDTPTPDIAASDDPEVIARGKYLVNSLNHCGACHSPAEDYIALQPGEESSLEGGHEWHMGPLGTIRSANITPDEATGIGSWTDAQVARAIRHGVDREGRGLLFMMSVGPMSDDDLIATISYLRTIESVSNEVAEHEVGVMGKILFQGPMDFFARPHDYASILPTYVAEGDAPSVERGEYLAIGPAFCAGCHSPYSADSGEVRFVGQVMSGGQAPFPDETEPTFEFSAPNLTADPDTGHIAQWTKEQYMERMKAGRVHKGSPMPWETYRNMTDADLESIWLYIESLPPTNNLVGPPRREAGWKAEGS